MQPILYVHEAIELIQKMELELSRSMNRCVSISAPEIGVDKSIAIIRVGTISITLINPEIIRLSDNMVQDEALCYSLPGKKIIASRPDEVHYDTLAVWGDELGDLSKKVTSIYQLSAPKLVRQSVVLGHWQQPDVCGGKVMVAVQHELDHILGHDACKTRDIHIVDDMLQVIASKDPGRNDPCPCGSGKKFKKCHGA